MASYSFHAAFYATGLQKNEIAAGLGQLAPIAARYGATHWAVYQSSEDLYKFLLVVDFPSKPQFEAYWYGEEARDFRAAMSGFFQNPVVYAPQHIVTEGHAVAPVGAAS